MPKKQRNAYYFYMQEQMPILKKQGRAFPNGMQDAAHICRPGWQAMSEKDREKYEMMANKYKATTRGTGPGCTKMDNQGQLISNRVDKFKEIDARKMQQKRDHRRKWPAGQDLADEKFYFIDFQILCRTDDGEVLPAEMALVEYSMRAGITKTYQVFIKNTGIPLGYRFICQEKSDNSHKIPITNFDKASDDYRDIWIQLVNFINPNGEKREHPPLYCLSTTYETVEVCIDWLFIHARVGRDNPITKLYELETMLIEFYEHIDKRPLSHATAYDVLTTTAFDYEQDTLCPYHFDVETKHCSLGICKIFAYSISDAMSTLYDFELTGKHLPHRPEVEKSKTLYRPTPAAFEEVPSRSRSRGRGRSVEQPEPEDDIFPARDFRYKNQPSESSIVPAALPVEKPTIEKTQTVRRPNQPGVAGQIAAASAQQSRPAANPWAAAVKPTHSAPVVNTNDDEEFPSLGGDPGPKFAGRMGAPGPAVAPTPPTAWQQPQPTVGHGIPGGLQARPMMAARGIGRGVGRGVGRGITVQPQPHQ